MTSKFICRILPHASANGVTNMAIDHALLNSVDTDPSSAVLRFYGWTEPTLSLGYFQSIAEARSEPRWRGVPTIRRSSGGGALLHDHELTYALVVPRSHPFALRPSALYRTIHSAIASALVAAGYPAARRGETTAKPDRPFLCFLDHDSEDILVSGTKVVGSAQRRRPNAVLQHGSILLAQSRLTPELPGLRELAVLSANADDLANRLSLALPEALGMLPCTGTMTVAEIDSAGVLEETVYAAESWTRRR